MTNAVAFLIDQAEQEGHRDRLALATPTGRCTYGELRDLTDRVAHARGLVKAFAFVVPRDSAVAGGSLIQDLAELAGRNLPSHQRPRQVFVVPELPRTATGKLQRFLLREEVRRLLPH